MLPLNLPACNLKIVQKAGKPTVFDRLRKRYVSLTPEEWVRQHFVHYLINHKQYPEALLGNEVSIKLNNTSKRCDTVLYGLNGMPRMIIEYKAPDIIITQKVFDQIGRYNIALHVDYLIVSNGREHYCCKIDYEHMRYQFLQGIPTYEEL